MSYDYVDAMPHCTLEASRSTIKDSRNTANNTFFGVLGSGDNHPPSLVCYTIYGSLYKSCNAPRPWIEGLSRCSLAFPGCLRLAVRPSRAVCPIDSTPFTTIPACASFLFLADDRADCGLLWDIPGGCAESVKREVIGYIKKRGSQQWSPKRAGAWELEAISANYPCTGARVVHVFLRIFLCCLVLFCCNLDVILQIEVLDMRGS